MSSNLDKTLDQVIAGRPKNNKRRATRRAPAKAALVGNKASAPAQKAKATAATIAAPSTEKKIIVSNLPTDVNETQIKELFSSQIGPCKVTLNYNAKGVSTGVANIIFNRAGDGTKAFQQYNGRLIDGKTPMKVEIVVDPTRPQSLSQRVGPAPAAGGVAAAKKKKKSRAPKKKGEPKAKKTLEDLDAEMVDYSSQAPSASNGAAAPAV